ncbi:HPr kinase/phosphorylase [Jannaschia sp. CCS1]|uniref:HPr kinase/phosphorylase n=1 Tax=Jannaschia sp. (strain CCS1) TaxID=290400 RepID=UPI000053C7BE|nr:HPr kinase [Jannaschia sp. CCS1]ABD53455.1 Hpr(Ser) kinase/phosphatase [Jannaschia sp. CCS1]
MTPPAEPLAERASARDGTRLFFHASAIVVAGKGALILGPSGSGKSSLALSLIALGAELISDDGVWVDPDRAQLQRPETPPPLIEARGVGLLRAGPICKSAPLSLVIDLSREESQRLPPRRMAALPDQKVELILARGHKTLAPIVFHLLRFGRAD